MKFIDIELLNQLKDVLMLVRKAKIRKRKCFVQKEPLQKERCSHGLIKK